MLTPWIGTLLVLVLATCSVVRGQTSAADVTLEALVVEALRDDDWQVRAAAASLLGAFGTEQHADELSCVLADERPQVWKAAWYARFSLRPGKLDRAMRCVADGETWADVGLLTNLLEPLVRAEHVDALAGEFERARSPNAQYALLLLLAAAGAKMPEPAVAYVRMCETPQQVLNASALLPLLPDTPEQRERVTSWLEHENAFVRRRSATWLLQHGASGAAIERHVIADYVDIEVYKTESSDAVRALGAEWMPTTKAAVLDTVGKARVVLVADNHGSKHIADLALDCCTASLRGGERGKVAFGYETPVEKGYVRALAAGGDFPPVSPRAEALGLVAVPLEPAERLPSLRSRDAAVNASIRAWLDRSADHKMVALYGSSHVLGRGHIDVPGAVRVLTNRPAYGLLQHLRAESLANGVLADDEHRWFLHRTRRDTFFVICEDRTWSSETRPVFTAWLANKLRK
jgi:hypothetical protein